MRGEQALASAAASNLKGSSPHARGTGSSRQRDASVVGIIPACAGNSFRERLRREGARDHPRMRGEQLTPRTYALLLPGSSPHARGTEGKRVDILLGSGIIPACAGNSSNLQKVVAIIGDHPRMRGEQSVSPDCPKSGGGSSPHARGTVYFHSISYGYKGIIPACAGNR